MEDGVDGADGAVHLRDLVDVLHHRDLVRDRDAHAAEVAQRAHARERTLHVLDRKCDVDEVEIQRLEGRVVDRRREAVPDRIADDGAELRAAADGSHR